MAFVKKLTEHLDTSNRRLLRCRETYDFDILTDFDNSALDTTSNNCSTTRDREHVLYRHQERLINGARWKRNVTINFSHKLQDRFFTDFRLLAFESHESRTFYDWNLVAWVFVFREKLADFELNEIEKLCVVNHVDFVHENNHRGDADLATEEDVLTSLWHRTVSRRYDQDRSIHLSRACDHVLYVIGVSWAINVCVVTVLSRVLNVRSRDRDTALFFFRSFIDLVERHSRCSTSLSENFGDSSCQACFAVIDVTDSSDIDVRFTPVKFLFSHFVFLLKKNRFRFVFVFSYYFIHAPSEPYRGSISLRSAPNRFSRGPSRNHIQNQKSTARVLRLLPLSH